MYLIYVNTDFILTAEQRASSNGEFWKTYLCLCSIRQGCIKITMKKVQGIINAFDTFSQTGRGLSTSGFHFLSNPNIREKHWN